MSDNTVSEENLALLGGLASRKPRPRRSVAENESAETATQSATEPETSDELTPSRRDSEDNGTAAPPSVGLEAEPEPEAETVDQAHTQGVTDESNEVDFAEDDTEITQKIVLPSLQTPTVAGFQLRAWQNPVLEGLMAVVLAIGVLALVALGGSEPKPPEPVMPDAEIMIVCPGIEGRPGTIVGSVNGEATLAPVSGTTQPELVYGHFELNNITEPMVLTATRGDSALNARFVTYQQGAPDDDPPGDRISEVNCAQPLASQYLLFPSSSGASVQLVNPDDTEAVFNVSALGPDGAVRLTDLRDMRLAAHSVTTIDVGAMLEKVAALTLRITNTTGRLLATGDVAASLGNEFSAATHIGRELLITGIPALPDHTRVILSNPATVRVTFSIVAVYADGTKDIAGADSVTLEAETTTVFDITEPLMGQPAALLVTANNDIAAAAAVSLANDFAVVPGVPVQQLVEQTLLVGVSHPAQLMLANPGEERIDVAVQWLTAGEPSTEPVSIPAKSSLLLDVPNDVKLIRVEVPATLGTALLFGTREGGQATVSLPAETQSAGRTPLRIVAHQP
ncbi:MAG: DUF5719 family protein [Propionibacteriaceae bacterium]|jgi:hypothetical protein|nr:DUF5719 family protein [Propionibacteriaceae bacterium]